jgi:hypothetical protein
MDWHFKMKDPDAAKRGVHRSWYFTEKVRIATYTLLMNLF